LAQNCSEAMPTRGFELGSAARKPCILTTVISTQKTVVSMQSYLAANSELQWV
jgi:hypothetical protein